MFSFHWYYPKNNTERITRGLLILVVSIPIPHNHIAYPLEIPRWLKTMSHLLSIYFQSIAWMPYSSDKLTTRKFLSQIMRRTNSCVAYLVTYVYTLLWNVDLFLSSKRASLVWFPSGLHQSDATKIPIFQWLHKLRHSMGNSTQGHPSPIWHIWD